MFVKQHDGCCCPWGEGPHFSSGRGRGVQMSTHDLRNSVLPSEVSFHNRQHYEVFTIEEKEEMCQKTTSGRHYSDGGRRIKYHKGREQGL